MDPVQWSPCTLTLVQNGGSFLGVNVDSLTLWHHMWDHVWDHVGFYMIHNFLNPAVECQLESFLSLIILILIQLKHLLYLLFAISSPVRVGTPLPLQECSHLAWGRKAYCTIVRSPINLPGIVLHRVTLTSGETLPARIFYAKIQSWSAVSTRPPTTSQHPMEK